MAGAIRNSAKALIIRGGKLLAVKMEEDGRAYYVLPGGGQRVGESLTETVCREVIDEIGLVIVPEELSFVYEGIHGERFHRVVFVFICRCIGDAEPCGADLIPTEWLDIDTLLDRPLYPTMLRGQIRCLFSGTTHSIYLGSKGTSDSIYIA